MRNKPCIPTGNSTLAALLPLAAALALAGSAALPFAAPAAAREATKDIPKHDGLLTLVVSLRKQRVDVYDRDGLVTSSPISSGTASHPTPTGIFTILEKNKTHFSNLYYSAPMPNMQRITWSGVALHAGVLPGYPASHGCIRLPFAFSRTLFSMTKVGTRVIVTNEPVDPPQAFAHARMPAALPPGEPLVPAASPAERTTIKSTAAGIGTVTAMLGVTPAVAAEAAVHHAAAEPAASQPAGPRTRAIARGERQGEIDRRASAIAAAEARHTAAADAVTAAVEAVRLAKLELKDARMVQLRYEQDKRATAARREQLERNLADFIRQQRLEAARAETRASRRQADHQADAASSRTTEDLLQRAAARSAEAERDAGTSSSAAIEEAQLEAALAATDLDAADSEAALASQIATVARLNAALDDAEKALPAARAAFASARNGLDEAKQAHARAVAALAQFDKPATVLVSRKTGTLYIRQGYQDVFQAPVTIAMPEAPIGTHVFTAVRYHDGSETELDWRAVTLSGAPADTPQKGGRKARAASMDDAPAMARVAPAITAANALDRIEMSPEVRMRVSELLKPGSTLILSDAGMSNETGKFTDIIVQPR